jgi:hypothetical protein
VVNTTRPIRLVAKPDGGARTAAAISDADRPQLTLIKGYKDELAGIVATYGEVEVFIRPATPVPPPALPRLMSDATRRKWLARETSRFEIVNYELPGPRPPPRLPIRQRSLRPPPAEEEGVPANSCIHCGEPVATNNMVEAIRLRDRRWEHLSCWWRHRDMTELGSRRKGIPMLYQGTRFRSRLEATWAAFFDRLKWRWQYEPFDLDGWIPDFALASVMDAPKPVLVEVKPIVGFDEEVAARIEAAADGHEVLLLGLGPFESGERYGQPRLSLGWLGEHVIFQRGNGPEQEICSWGHAVLGRWIGEVGKTKNRDRLIGFCHEDGSFIDRITGCYDGGRLGRETISHEEIFAHWAAAKNAVQWRPA